MPVQWYQRKRQSGDLGDFFRLSDVTLRFSVVSYEKYFEKKSHIAVGYDEENNCIYFRPNNDREGFKVLLNRGLPYIRWVGFTGAFKIHFDHTCSVKIKNGYQKDVFFLDLKGCSRTSESYQK